jgi:hypothetical protein
MEEASEAERNKPARPYDGLPVLTEEHKQRGSQLLATAATPERGYQALRENANGQVSQPPVRELEQLHRQWRSDLDSFKNALRAQGVDPKTLAYVNEAFARLAERIKPLAG